MNYGVPHRAAFHRKGLSRPSLPVCEDTDVVAIRTTLSKLRNFLEHFRLRTLWLKYLKRGQIE
jgi:hypothetical protein